MAKSIPARTVFGVVLASFCGLLVVSVGRHELGKRSAAHQQKLWALHEAQDLARDLDEFADHWIQGQPTAADMSEAFEDEFHSRMVRVINELKEHGQHDPELDAAAELWEGIHRVHGLPLKPEMVHDLAGRIMAVVDKRMD
jgi:hypothetical protein